MEIQWPCFLCPYSYAVSAYSGFPRSCNWTKAKSDTAHAQSFDVACTCDRFSLFSLQELGKPLYSNSKGERVSNHGENCWESNTHVIIFPCIFRYYSAYSKNSALAQLTVEVEEPIQGLFNSEKALLTQRCLLLLLIQILNLLNGSEIKGHV
jgi:hypothetical protein